MRRWRDSPALRLAFAAARFLLVPVAVVWLVGSAAGIDWAGALSADPLLLALALLVNQVSLSIFALRMQLALRLCCIALCWLDSLRVHLQSMFYFFLLPMTVGLEISRFIKVRALRPGAGAKELGLALLLDRVVGAVSALFVALLCLPFLPLAVRLGPTYELLAAALAIVAAAAGGALVFGPLRRRVRPLWDAFRGRLPALGGLLLLSMGMHVIFALGVFCAAEALGLGVPFLHILFAVAGGMLLVAIPISLAGLGPAEAGAAAILIALAHEPGVAVAVAGLPYLARLAGAIEGAVWELADSGIGGLTQLRALAAESRMRNAA